LRDERQGRLRRRALFAILVAGVLGLAFLALHARPVQKWVLRTVLESVSARAPGRITVGTLDYRLWRGEATVREVRFEGDSGGTLEWVRADEVRVRWAPLRKVAIVAFRPVIQLRARPGDPDRKPARVEPSVPAWIEAIRIVGGEVRFRGIEGDDSILMGPLDADLREDFPAGGLRGRIHLGGGHVAFAHEDLEIHRVDVDAMAVGGDVEVEARSVVTEAGDVEGTGHIETLSPFAADFDLDFRLDAARLEELFLEGDAGMVAGDLQGSVRLELTEHGLVSAGDAEGARLAFRGVGPFDGNVRWDLRDDLLRVEGAFHDGASRIETEAALDLKRNEQTMTVLLEAPSLKALLRDVGAVRSPWDSGLQARFSARMAGYSADTLTGEGRVSLSGGEISGRIDVGADRGRIVVDARKLAFPGGTARARARISGFQSVAAEYRVGVGDLSTTLEPFDGDLARWLGGELRVAGRSEGPLRELASLRSSVQLSSENFRLRGSPFLVNARLEQRGSSLHLDPLSLVAAGNGAPGEITVAGGLDLGRRTMDLAGSLVAFPIQHLAQVDGLSATATGSFEVRGGFRRPSGRATLSLSPVHISERELPPMRLDARSDGERVTAEILRLDSSAPFARARVPLRGDYLLEGEVDLEPIPWGDLAPELPGGRPEISAIEVSGEARIQVPMTAPSRLEARVTVREAALELGERRISTSPFELNVRRESAEVHDLALLFGDEELAIEGIVGLAEGVETRLALEGNVPFDAAEPWLPGRDIEGLLHLDLELSRSLRDPRLHGEIAITGGGLIEAVAAQGVPRTIESLEVRAEAAGAHIRVESLEADVLGGELAAHGTIPIPGVKDGTAARLAFDVSGIDAARFAESVRGSQAIATSLSVEGEVLFPEGRFDRFEASGEIQDVLVASEAGVVSLAEPAEWRYGASGAYVEEIRLEGDRTDLRVGLSPPGGEEGGALAVSLEGRVDLQMVNAALPDTTFLGGVAAVDVDVTTGESIRYSGSASVSEGELAISDPAFAVTDLSAEIELDGGILRVRTLSARAGGGTIASEGVVTIPGTGGAGSGIRLDLEADGVGIEYPEGMKSALNARLVFESRADRYRLSGDVEILQALYERAISPEREILEALRREVLDLKGEAGLTGRIDLDLSVSTERAVVVDNNLGEMRWDAGLLVRGTLAGPEASGTLSSYPGGKLTFLGNTYEIETARVVLDSYPLEPPELDIRAQTEVAGREIVLSISGRTDNLRTSLESPSDPALSRGDVASLLLTGRTLEEVRGREADVLGREAATYLGSTLAQLTESSLASALPISTVRLEPGIVGSETDPGVRFSIGRAITDDLFLTYSIGLDDAEKQLWIVDYSLPARLKLRAIRDDSNDYTGGLSQDALFDFYDRDRPQRLDSLAKPEIRDIAIEGEAALSAEEIDDALDLDVGDGYDYWSAREDADELMKELRARGHLSAQAEPYTRPAETPPGEPLTLVYDVDPGPLVDIRWSGDPVPPDIREWVRKRFEGYVPPQAQARRIARELEWRLMSRGHYGAAVEPTVQDLGRQVDIVYDVGLGPKGQGVEIEIEGNDRLSDEDIGRLFPPESSPEFFELVLGRAEKLREELRLLYAGEGYLDVRVLSLAPRLHPETSRLFVILRVEEGEPFRVGEIVFSGASSLSEDRLRSGLSTEEGTPFRFLDHLGDRRRIASLYRGEGFPDVRVRSSLRRGDRRVDVVFDIDEGERIYVGETRIAGARATREGVIRDAATFERGDPLRVSDLTETQQRLYNLGVFRSVEVTTEPSSEEGVRDVAIELTELPDLRVAYGGRYNTEDHLEVTGDVELTNLLGTGQKLGFHAFANRRLTEMRATFAVPSFLGRDVGWNFFIARETEEGEGFESRAWSATLQQGRRLFSDVLAQWSFTHRQSAVRETIPSGPFGFDVEADRSVLSFSLIQDTRSSLTRPTSGRFWNATLQFAPQFLGSDLRFIKLYGQFFYYRSLWGNVVWASTYRAGIADGFGQVLLPTDRFRAGGPSSVRGYPVNELGPPDPITGTPIGGEGIVVVNQELRFPLFWRLGGIAFYDAGNVFLTRADFNPFDLRHTTGLGLSVDLPVGLVTVDWAVLLNPQPGLARTRWVFTYGYSF
jgi:outer membrane protein insertion porin family